MGVRHWLGAAAIGAVSMFLLDPDHGGARVSQSRVTLGGARLERRAHPPVPIP